MSAKLLYNLSDENPNLKKQIGCMNGIFQVFYRQHCPARRVASTINELKSLPSGKTSGNVGDTNISTDNKETEKSKKKKALKEIQRRVSSESSSRLSFSSSPCSSSFSSADISTTPPSQFEQHTGETPRWGSLKKPSDLRELVKSSMHKETRTRHEEALSLQPQSARANEGQRVVKLKDSPRFSYDERETRKTGSKLKETPRLSLDSRSTSFRSARSSCLQEPQELLTDHKRTTTSSSVVAKLMGLEDIPDKFENNHNRENRFCDSPRPITRVETDLRRSRSFDSIKKMIPAKKAAPGRQQDGDKGAATPTIYGEIQNRLSQLQFNKSEKDLRALKQILEAMELISKNDENKTLCSTNLMQRTDQPNQSTTSPASKNFRSSSIVVTKTAVAPGTSGPGSVLPRNVTLPNVKVGNLRQSQNVIPRKQRAMDVTPRLELFKGKTDSTMKRDMAKSGERQKPNDSPRTQPHKLVLSRPTSPKPEPNKIQRQKLSRQQSESASPRRKPGIKSRVSEDRLSDESSDLRSIRSDSTVSLASNFDIEVRSSDITEQATSMQMSPDLGMRSLPKPLKVTVEQPSPISVLDVAFDEDDSPSPVKKISIVFRDDDVLSSEEVHRMNKHSNLCRSIVWPEINMSQKQPEAEGFTEEDTELQNADHKYIADILLASGLLRDIDYSMISIQLHQANLPINPSLFFVLEQNKTSNVSVQDNKHKDTVNLLERSKRKLIFDTINMILARRFAAEGCTKQPPIVSSISPCRITEKSSRGKELLHTLCAEIDRLQDNSKCILDEDDEDLIWEDLQSHGMNWKEIQGETPGLVLDIERLIFKDLISEVVAS